MNVLSEVDTRGFDEMINRTLSKLDDPKQQRDYLRAEALDFVGRVIPRTPLDTGRARGGWTAMRGSRRAAPARLGPNAPEGRRMSSYREDFGRGRAFIEITNGVPYIVYLELGSSEQAPGGFVRLTLREMSRDMAQGALENTLGILEEANNEARAVIGLRQGLGRQATNSPAAILRR